MSVLVLTYHAVEAGPPPLCVEPALFAAQLDAIVESGVPALTISQLGDALREERLPNRAVAITFDDGAASVARNAAPLLAERGLTATVYCVAGYLGRRNEWPSQRADALRFELATAEELIASGLELGSHGVAHEPLLDPAVATREVVESKQALEQALGREVTTFAYPYGIVGAIEAVRETYSAACATGMTTVGPGSDPWTLSRVDIHYLRRPELLRRALTGNLGPYLGARRAAARARRMIRSDYR